MEQLPDLEDISDTLVFEDYPSIFNDDHAVEFVETALHLMEEYVSEHPQSPLEADFHETLLEEVKELLEIQMEDHLVLHETVEEDMENLLEDAFLIFCSTFLPSSEEPVVKDEIAAKIDYLRSIPQPVQRTAEWYQFRWNLITASNAWKAFESQAAINQLIYEKCQPVKSFDAPAATDGERTVVNTNTSLHWGQKYEPLSVMIYEHKYGTVVEDFGCIQHNKYPFVGASPDGIVVNAGCDRYGRMLEIKNVVSREITGIPKKEYWTQMQLQMEVCDLDLCDFLETKFTEYPSRVEYETDKEAEMKGIIIYFLKPDGAPLYEYKPLDIVEPEAIEQWENEQLEKHAELQFIKYLYWKLAVFSCIQVHRDKSWFRDHVGQLQSVWETIEKERVTGYEHRAPKKRNPTTTTSSKKGASQEGGVCLIQVVKLEG